MNSGNVLVLVSVKVYLFNTRVNAQYSIILMIVIKKCIQCQFLNPMTAILDFRPQHHHSWCGVAVGLTFQSAQNKFETPVVVDLVG